MEDGWRDKHRFGEREKRESEKERTPSLRREHPL
jgi:hypothetical protein